MPTPNEILVAEEEQAKKDDARFTELNAKAETERTPEENQELAEVKERYGKRMQKKIDKLTWETKTAQEQLERERQEKLRIQQENDELKKGKGGFSAELPKEIYTEINGKKWLTDEALVTKINSGEITETDAYSYQRKRDNEATVVRVKEELLKDERQRQEQNLKLQDIQKVLGEHPNFAKMLPDGNPNPSFNPNDPLYKMTNEIYLEGYASIPDGLSKALRRAKQILRISEKNIDRTEELNIDNITPHPERTDSQQREITLTEDEKDAAVKMFCRGDVINPKTKRPYTVQEAYISALEAKKMRQRRV